jgi:hypothetical protein
MDAIIFLKILTYLQFHDDSLAIVIKNKKKKLN